MLGGYETFYNRVVHGFPVAPIGLYAFLPLPMLWALRRARSLMRAGDADAAARGVLLFFCLFQIGYVVAASSVFTFRESARYRYQVEAMIWLVSSLCVVSLWGSLLRRGGAPRMAANAGEGNVRADLEVRPSS